MRRYAALIVVTVVLCGGGADSDNDNDGALYLTPMIRDGRIDEARAACRVDLTNATTTVTTPPVESCSGYLTVDDRFGSNMFFWFFPAANGSAASAGAPVVLWLQGGPGASSLYSVFNEHGPFSVRKGGGGTVPRDHAWTSTHSMLYVDNPVGTGYSFTGHEDGYSVNQTAVGRNLYAALVQFFTLFPEYRLNDFYAAGESYAGKYVPAVSYAIHLNNPGAEFKINLKGLAIGNGLIDPVNQMVYSEFLYQIGFIDEDGKRRFAAQENKVRNCIAAGDFKGALRDINEMMIGTPSLYSDRTGMRTIYNVAWNRNPIPFVGGDWDRYAQEPATRAALHVGWRPWASMDAVYERLMYDIPRSVSEWLAALLDAGQYRVLLYSGHLDVIVPYRGTVCVANALRWSGAEQFRNATRTVWRVAANDTTATTTAATTTAATTTAATTAYTNITTTTTISDTIIIPSDTPLTTPDAVTVGIRNRAIDDGREVAGYATAYGPLTVLMVRNAGHMVPYDQPRWAHDLIKRFTSGRPFDDDSENTSNNKQ